MDTVLLEHRREWRTEETRISGVERELAVLQTKFESLIEWAVDSDRLKELEDKIMSAVSELVKGANSQQSQVILGEVRNIFDTYRTTQREERIAELKAVLNERTDNGSRWKWWVLGILGGLIVSAGSVLFGMWMAGAFHR